MKRMLFPSTVLLTVGLLFACGGSMSPVNVTNGVPMSVTIGDIPPSGVAVLFFEASFPSGTLATAILERSLERDEDLRYLQISLPPRLLTSPALVASPFSHL